MTYTKKDIENIDRLSMKLGIECWMKEKDEGNINNLIEEILQIYKKYK